MTLRPLSFTVSLERERLGPSGSPERVRLAVELPAEAGPEEIGAALERLRAELDRTAGPAAPTEGGTRSVEELVETYRPRQAELVELLRAENEISEPEAELLRGYLQRGGGAPAAPRPEPPGLPPPGDRPLAALPLANDRTPLTPRPIPQLLEQYRIETLRQAGAVRARRQISYEEYMALKRHFAAAEALAAGAARTGDPPSDAPSAPSGGG